MASQMENVIASINKHIADQLSGSWTLEFRGVDLDTEAQTNWIRVDYLDVARTFIRNVSTTERGHVAYVPVSFNCFSKSETDTYKTLEMRDAVFTAMKPMTEITLKNYAGDSSTLGTMQTWDVVSDVALPMKDGIRGHNVTISVRFEESF